MFCAAMLPVAAESLARSRGVKAPGDLNESFMIGEPDPPNEPYFQGEAAGNHFAPNLWPERPPELRPVWTAYFREMERLATDIMRVFALALDLPESYFDDKIDRHISRVRVRLLSAAIERQRIRAEPGRRAYRLRQSDNPEAAGRLGGPAGQQERNWIDVPNVPGCFIINIGDLMARWTNDRWVSTLHRVVVPQSDAARRQRRLSVVFFHNPNYDAVIECIPGCSDGRVKEYPPTRAGDYLKSKFLAAQTAAGAYVA